MLTGWFDVQHVVLMFYGNYDSITHGYRHKTDRQTDRQTYGRIAASLNASTLVTDHT